MYLNLVFLRRSFSVYKINAARNDVLLEFFTIYDIYRNVSKVIFSPSRFAKHFSHWHSVIAATDYCSKASNVKRVAIGFTSDAPRRFPPSVNKTETTFSTKTKEKWPNSMYSHIQIMFLKVQTNSLCPHKLPQRL